MPNPQEPAAAPADPRRWLVTGAAGFIGSHLVEGLLRRGAEVTGLDDFSTGHRANLDAVAAAVGASAWSRFRLLEGDIRDAEACAAACDGAEVVLHQAALSSVPLSMAEPARVLSVNVDGFAKVLEAARQAGVSRFVYASSSAVYGDETTVPAVEHRIGRPLSPYGASKHLGEQMARLYDDCFGLGTVGLRYFNVLGSRQDPDGAYAAVIPRWFAEFRRGVRPAIFGDGETTRDFCPVEDIVQANLLAGTGPAAAGGPVYNVALGRSTSLNELYAMIRDLLAAEGLPCGGWEPDYGPFRAGDVRHSRADISRAREALGFTPSAGIEEALRQASGPISG